MLKSTSNFYSKKEANTKTKTPSLYKSPKGSNQMVIQSGTSSSHGLAVPSSELRPKAAEFLQVKIYADELGDYGQNVSTKRKDSITGPLEERGLITASKMIGDSEIISNFPQRKPLIYANDRCLKAGIKVFKPAVSRDQSRHAFKMIPSLRPKSAMMV